MKIILDVPKHTMCVGIFVNYKTEEQYKDKEKPFCTTNCLIDTEKYCGVRIDENGTLNFVAESGLTDEINAVLDKIRAKIEEQYSGNGAMNDGIDVAIGVVDKYMKEIGDE